MSLFVCAKCGCVDNTATSSYWMLTNEYMVDKFDYAKELQPYKGMGLCSECGRLATPPQTAVMSWCPVNGTGSSRRRKLPKSS